MGEQFPFKISNYIDSMFTKLLNLITNYMLTNYVNGFDEEHENEGSFVLI